MPAIKATNSKGLKVTNCDFYGFETDIELDNVEDFVSDNNRFSKDNDPRLLLSMLSVEIQKSGLDKSSKERLAKEVIKYLSSKPDSKKESKLKAKLKYLGDKTLDLFIQLASAVAAGLILHP